MNELLPRTCDFPALAEEARTFAPQVALVLGSGMSDLVSRLRVRQTAAFLDVPGLAAPTVAGHPGRLVLGEWAGKRILVFAGRLHYYEGFSWRQVTAPIQGASYLGARVLLLTSAAGGIHNALNAGSFMVVRDHIEWTRPAPWKYPGPGGLGPARSSPYSLRLGQTLLQAAVGLGMNLHQGIYAAVPGPCYETPAEIRALKAWGADAVGMSTTREIQAGCDLGMECAAICCIANRAAGLGTGPIDHGEVLRAASAAKAPLADLIEAFLQRV